MDMFLEKLSIRNGKEDYLPELELNPLPEPVEVEQVGVDGGGGAAKLEGGKVLYVARAIAVSEEGIVRDLKAEVAPWESKPLLEAMRSFVELSVALKAPQKELLIDGSVYTMLTRWLQRVTRVALMKARTSEIISLPYTLLALEKLVAVIKRKPIFISKSPKFKVFKDYLVLKKIYEIKGDDRFYEMLRTPELDKKALMIYLKDREIKDLIRTILNAAISDIDIVRGEGYSFGLELGIPQKVRRVINPPILREIVQMARENYEMTTGEEAPKVNLEDLCYSPSPVAWWVSKARVKFVVEELSGRPLCLSALRVERKEMPASLPHLIVSDYNPWLTLAHSISTLKGEQLMMYLQLLRAKTGLDMEAIREDLLSTSRAR
jgi:hypothetical protein